jgi:hypothetical protein
MSTASETDTDFELDSALEDILGEALREAENPIVDAEVGGRGHIEGSRAFPKELVEEVRSLVMILYACKKLASITSHSLLIIVSLYMQQHFTSKIYRLLQSQKIIIGRGQLHQS